jgi:hypothetical protein
MQWTDLVEHLNLSAVFTYRAFRSRVDWVNEVIRELQIPQITYLYERVQK